MYGVLHRGEYWNPSGRFRDLTMFGWLKRLVSSSSLCHLSMFSCERLKRRHSFRTTLFFVVWEYQFVSVSVCVCVCVCVVWVCTHTHTYYDLQGAPVAQKIVLIREKLRPRSLCATTLPRHHELRRSVACSYILYELFRTWLPGGCKVWQVQSLPFRSLSRESTGYFPRGASNNHHPSQSRSNSSLMHSKLQTCVWTRLRIRQTLIVPPVQRTRSKFDICR